MSANACQAQCAPPFTPVIPAVPHSWTLPAEDVSAGKARRRVAAALPQLVPWRQRRPDPGEGLVRRADGYLWLAVADAG